MAHFRIFRFPTQALGANLVKVSYHRYTVSRSFFSLHDTYMDNKVVNQSLALFVNSTRWVNLRNDIIRPHSRPFVTSSSLFKKRMSRMKIPEKGADDSLNDDEVLNDPQFDSLRNQSRLQALVSGASGQVGVMVLQPWVKWGHQKRTDTSGELMLQEAVALVSTLPVVTVVAKVSCPYHTFKIFIIFLFYYVLQSIFNIRCITLLQAQNGY